MSNVKPQIAPELKQGLFAEDIKQIPKVRAFLESIIDEERNKAFEKGYQEGLEQGKAKAYQQSESEYKEEFKTYLLDNKAKLESVIQSLVEPLPSLAVEVENMLISSFNKALLPVLSDPSIYDAKLKIQIDEIVASCPENNREVHIEVSAALNEEFSDYFSEVVSLYGATVAVVEMDDLVRLVTSSGSFRFSHKEYIQKVLSGEVL